jgi:hypothetical protein
MARYSVYHNILVKLDNVFLQTETKVDKEVSVLLAEQRNLSQRMIDLKGKVALLSSFKNAKEMVRSELKKTSCELEQVLFKEYAIKQRIQELRDYKIVLNSQKNNFMKDPTIDGYTEAMHQLQAVENHFQRLIMHKNFAKATQDSLQGAMKIHSLPDIVGMVRKPQTYELH